MSFISKCRYLQRQSRVSSPSYRALGDSSCDVLIVLSGAEWELGEMTTFAMLQTEVAQGTLIKLY